LDFWILDSIQNLKSKIHIAMQDLPHPICNPDFWRELNPGLSITESAVPWSPLKFDPDELAEIAHDLQTEGYFQIGPLLPELEVFLMGTGIATLHEANIPAVFAFVYDEYWQVYMRLARLLAGILGDGYRLLPSFWAWCIEPDPNQAGWGPHRDRLSKPVLREDHSPNIMTIWIPLSDATPLNGCMYVIPAHHDPYYVESQTTGYQDNLSLIAVVMQSVRALPAPAGSILGWTHSLFHWGGHSSIKTEVPRISLSVEFQRGDVAAFTPNLLEPLIVPSFERRLQFIAKQILRYRHMYPLSEELANLAEQLCNSAQRSG
jgi:hypothetical protein